MSGLCHREGCAGILQAAGRKFCSRRCANMHAAGRFAQPQPKRAAGARAGASSPTTSWWMKSPDDPDTFYEDARKRFPPDDPHVDRRKVFVGGTNDVGRKERARQSQRHARQTFSNRKAQN
jgi:hypothetical protein